MRVVFARHLNARLPSPLSRGTPDLSFWRNCVSAYTGDEAQIFLRAANGPVGIGAKRYETGQILLRNFPDTSMFVLDDGFQHALIARDLDIVIIDGLEPFGSEELVPLGRLREPLEALHRAGIFVVTRTPNDLRFAAIKAVCCNTMRMPPSFGPV